MGFHILVRWHLYIESGPKFLRDQWVAHEPCMHHEKPIGPLMDAFLCQEWLIITTFITADILFIYSSAHWMTFCRSRWIRHIIGDSVHNWAGLHGVSLACLGTNVDFSLVSFLGNHLRATNAQATMLYKSCVVRKKIILLKTLSHLPGANKYELMGALTFWASFLNSFFLFFLKLIVTCRVCVIYVREDNNSNV